MNRQYIELNTKSDNNSNNKDKDVQGEQWY